MTGERGTPRPDGIGTAPRLVVGLGASAGGVQTVREFFAHVEPGWGIAYVVVLHLRPDRQSPGSTPAGSPSAWARGASMGFAKIARDLLEPRGDSVVLVVEDDDAGSEVSEQSAARRGFGLAGMRERAALIGGALHIESTTRGGTSVFLRCGLGTAAAGPST